MNDLDLQKNFDILNSFDLLDPMTLILKFDLSMYQCTYNEVPSSSHSKVMA